MESTCIENTGAATLTPAPNRRPAPGGTNDRRFAAALGLLRRFEEPFSLEREIRARQRGPTGHRPLTCQTHTVDHRSWNDFRVARAG